MTDLDRRIREDVLVQDLILSGFQGTFGIINYKNISDNQIQKVNNIMQEFELDKTNSIYSELSDGQKKKALIARSIINNPKVLILDEPTNMLDLKANYEMLNMLSKLTRKGITLLYVTNTIESIIRETHRVILLKGGQVTKDGQPSKILTSKNLSQLYDYNLSVKYINGYWRSVPI